MEDGDWRQPQVMFFDFPTLGVCGEIRLNCPELDSRWTMTVFTGRCVAPFVIFGDGVMTVVEMFRQFFGAIGYPELIPALAD